MSTGEASDDELLAASGADAEAFGEFYRRHSGAVLAYLAYRTRDPEQAVDLMAETFAAAFAASERYRPGPVPARGWLFGIAKQARGGALPSRTSTLATSGAGAAWPSSDSRARMPRR